MKIMIVLLTALIIAISCNQPSEENPVRMKPLSILWDPNGLYLASVEITTDDAVDSNQLPYNMEDMAEFKKITGDTILIIGQEDTSMTTDVRGDTIVLSVIEDYRSEGIDYLDSTVTYWIVVDVNADKIIDSMYGKLYNKNINFKDTTYREGNITCSKM